MRQLELYLYRIRGAGMVSVGIVAAANEEEAIKLAAEQYAVPAASRRATVGVASISLVPRTR